MAFRRAHWMQEPKEMENWPLIMILVTRNGQNDDIGGDADDYADCRCNGNGEDNQILFLVWMH